MHTRFVALVHAVVWYVPAEHDAVHVEQTRLEDVVHAALIKFSDGHDEVHLVHEVALPSTVKFEP